MNLIQKLHWVLFGRRARIRQRIEEIVHAGVMARTDQWVTEDRKSASEQS